MSQSWHAPNSYLPHAVMVCTFIIQEQCRCTVVVVKSKTVISESMEWIEKTGLDAYGETLIWDDGADGCDMLGQAASFSYDQDSCKNSCLDDVNNCNAINYMINTWNQEKYCMYYECPQSAEPTSSAAVPTSHAYLYTIPG